ncbi:amino acid ABC transporter permease [Sansalvadorimonas verongulae]|uniref:amino acid ABC transporter permease n=1 Tax=Sansalvadorimonas verongulae TaxID=2172824 RepID=UPI0012BC6349|nr:amino acid ABC transporter permease [Sansalvadorimonas verongulae]MTI13045.1 amino acid ABC transporter permease [Sansalvadorimonas verongulae]
MIVNDKNIPSRPAPASTRGIAGWLRENLFSTPGNSVLTFMGLAFLVWAIPPIFQWAVLQADFIGVNKEACTSEGACWVFVSARFQQFMYGFYPDTELWRVNIFFAQMTAVLVWVLWDKMPRRTWGGVWFLTGFPLTSFILLHGGFLGLETVETHKWGGLMLTLVLSLVGMVIALPIGILLALGRRSDMPAVSSFCTVFIEIWRGVPLITILFMASVMLPLFIPGDIELDKLARAMIGISLFEAALIAEVIRGGLQAMPKGQYEAADAMGLSYWQGMRLIIMPQVLKISIPGIVNTFVQLFKDTSLVLIIGLFDLLAVMQAGITDVNWPNISIEAFVFTGFVFWAFCFGMSRYSVALERKLDTGHKS